MALEKMTSMERTLTALSHKEPDRVPLFLLLTMHGAKETGLPLKEYYSSGKHVAIGQMKLHQKYRTDCFYPFFYAAVEVEAYGAEVLYRDDGPPNAGEPFIKDIEGIPNLIPPKIQDKACLQKVLQAIDVLKTEAGSSVPIIGVVMSPFSAPVMQLGFEKYLDLIYYRQDRFEQLIKINIEFCVEWANAQLDAGASAICYFDPLASPTMIEREKYLETGWPIAKSAISRIKGPVAVHLASGISAPVVDDIAATGAAVIGVSAADDLKQLKQVCKNKISILGNMNGIEMAGWSNDTAESIVKTIINSAGPGGGFILSDNHGEIPFQVPDSVLLTISDTVESMGRYPLG